MKELVGLEQHAQLPHEPAMSGASGANGVAAPEEACVFYKGPNPEGSN